MLRYKKQNTSLLIEVSTPSDFGLKNMEIRKMTKYQDLKNEVKRTWKLKSIDIVPVIIIAMVVIQKNLTEILKAIPGNITSNELQMEAVQDSVIILKRTLRPQT